MFYFQGVESAVTCSTAGERVADPDDCRKYYICSLGVGKSLIPQLTTCPNGWFFDSSRNVCDLATSVYCALDHSGTPVPSTATGAATTTIKTLESSVKATNLSRNPLYGEM